MARVHLLVEAKIAIFDHDGYCSGNECEYQYVIRRFPILLSPGERITRRSIKKLMKKWAIGDPFPNKSGYCNASAEAPDDCIGMEKHSARLLEWAIELAPGGEQ